MTEFDTQDRAADTDAEVQVRPVPHPAPTSPAKDPINLKKVVLAVVAVVIAAVVYSHYFM